MAIDLPKLRKLLALDPSDGLSRFALGRKLLMDGGTAEELDEAIFHLRYSLEKDPSHLATYHKLAQGLVKAGRLGEAKGVLVPGVEKARAVGEGMGHDLGPIMEKMLLNIQSVIPTVRLGRVDEIIDLRWRVLRDGLPREEAMFPHDDDAECRHALAVDESGAVICCATMHPEGWHGNEAVPAAPAWRLRGMATDAAWQGKGAGARVLRMLEEVSQVVRPTGLLWCNARVRAIPFYERAGWVTRSELFDIPTAGPHKRMTKEMRGF